MAAESVKKEGKVIRAVARELPLKFKKIGEPFDLTESEINAIPEVASRFGHVK